MCKWETQATLCYHRVKGADFVIVSKAQSILQRTGIQLQNLPDNACGTESLNLEQWKPPQAFFANGSIRTSHQLVKNMWNTFISFVQTCPKEGKVICHTAAWISSWNEKIIALKFLSPFSLRIMNVKCYKIHKRITFHMYRIAVATMRSTQQLW